jgi:hypothetical protein
MIIGPFKTGKATRLHMSKSGRKYRNGVTSSDSLSKMCVRCLAFLSHNSYALEIGSSQTYGALQTLQNDTSSCDRWPQYFVMADQKKNCNFCCGTVSA